MIEVTSYVHAEIVGTDKVSQFRGWVIYRHKAIMLYGASVSGVKKLWVDFFN